MRFENITATRGGHPVHGTEIPSVIWGKPGAPVENVAFRNVRIVVKGGHPTAEAALDPAENDGRFPRDIGAVPAFGFYLRHVRDIAFFD